MNTEQFPQVAESQPRIPHWASLTNAKTDEDLPFLSGAALATLHPVLSRPSLPGALLGERLALQATVACLKLEGRNENPSDIRDAVCLTRAGDSPGPAGEMFLRWRRFARINLRASGADKRVLSALPDQINRAIDTDGLARIGSGCPVRAAATDLSNVLLTFPQQEGAALMLADMALARAFRWPAPLPLLAHHISRTDLRGIARKETDPAFVVHRALVSACSAALTPANDPISRFVAVKGEQAPASAQPAVTATT